MPAPDATTRLTGARPLLLGCFFVSGFTALAYQTVRMRLALYLVASAAGPAYR